MSALPLRAVGEPVLLLAWLVANAPASPEQAVLDATVDVRTLRRGHDFTREQISQLPARWAALQSLERPCELAAEMTAYGDVTKGRVEAPWRAHFGDVERFVASAQAAATVLGVARFERQATLLTSIQSFVFDDAPPLRPSSAGLLAQATRCQGELRGLAVTEEVEASVKRWRRSKDRGQPDQTMLTPLELLVFTRAWLFMAEGQNDPTTTRQVEAIRQRYVQPDPRAEEIASVWSSMQRHADRRAALRSARLGVSDVDLKTYDVEMSRIGEGLCTRAAVAYFSSRVLGAAEVLDDPDAPRTYKVGILPEGAAGLVALRWLGCIPGTPARFDTLTGLHAGLKQAVAYPVPEASDACRTSAMQHEIRLRADADASDPELAIWWIRSTLALVQRRCLPLPR